MSLHIVVAGAAGLIGRNLCETLLQQGHHVIGLDNLVTGTQANIEGLSSYDQFEFHNVDICDATQFPQIGNVDQIYNMASPASPVDFSTMPLFILKTSSQGHMNLLDLAHKHKARVLLASTSEVYGDPLVHPQEETYWGNVNSTGPRSCYDEAKRYGEALSMAHHRELGTNTALARIFNTYGPYMRANDGRVIPNFLSQALSGQGLTVYGDGTQTRSLCYVSDMVAGLIALMNSSLHQPVNIGNPNEMTIIEIAEAITQATGKDTQIEFRPLPQDDPKQRCPDIGLAKQELGWEPIVGVEEGMKKTVEYFKTLIY